MGWYSYYGWRPYVSVAERRRRAAKKIARMKKAGRDVSPVARSSDGLIEAAVVERDDWWVKGVQWHPEDLLHQPIQKQLWRRFLGAAAAAPERRGEEA